MGEGSEGDKPKDEVDRWALREELKKWERVLKPSKPFRSMEEVYAYIEGSPWFDPTMGPQTPEELEDFLRGMDFIEATRKPGGRSNKN
jgi:hypothetical protein